MPLPAQSIHTSRTLMLAEWQQLMAQAQVDQDFERALRENATGKRTKANQTETHRYLRTLYDLDPALPRFRALMAFWKMVEAHEQPLLALLYALGKDFLLAESVPLITASRPGDTVPAKTFTHLVSGNHPNRYSETSLIAIGQRLASSWKQVGYLRGMYKNERVEPKPSYLVLTFAMLLPYLAGVRGQYLLESLEIRALCLSEARLRALAFEASKRDLMRFQSAGAVTTVSFAALAQKLEIHEIKD